MNTAKKSLFRTVTITTCLVALGAFFQTGRSASMFSEEPLPTVQVTLRPGVEWMTIRNLPVEASTIWQENGQVFAVSRPIINSAEDAALYQELLQSRLDSLPNEQVLKAEVTFKAPLTLADIESLLGQYAILSLLAGGEDGSTGRVSYPPEEIPAEVQEGFSQVYEALSRGTPAPSLSPDNYIAATVKASTLLLRELAQKEPVYTVDVGPVDLMTYFPGGDFSPLKDVSYDYESHVGSFCEFALLRNRIDDLSANGEIPEVVRDELKGILINSEAYLNANDILSARSEIMLFFETLAENSAAIAEGALKEAGIVGDCLIARKMQSDNLYNFTGFFSPIDNQPTLNVVKAGSAVPVKFSLNGYSGLDIFYAGYPASAVVTCGSSVEDSIEQTVTAGGSNLSYDAATDQYIYVWKTDMAWVNTCRTFVIRLRDGMYYRADFKFRK